MPVVRKWMRRMAEEDGSRNFINLMDTAERMLSEDREARPYSWEIEIYLYEQFHPDEPGYERRRKMRGLIPQSTAYLKPKHHNPLVGPIAERNAELVKFLQENGWKLGESSSPGGLITGSESKFGIIVNLLENFTPSISQTAELFKRTYKARGHDWNGTANEGEQHRCQTLAQIFAQRVDSTKRTLCEIKCILEPRHPLDSMKIFLEEVDVNQRDGDENTALFWASRGGDVMTVDILLRYGAEVNPTNKLHGTPLTMASMLGHAGVVGRLLDEVDVKVNYRNDQQRTSLLYAAQFGHTKVVEILLDYGADPQLGGIRGRTPLSLAAGSGNLEIVELLLETSAVDSMRAVNEGASPLTHAMAEQNHRKWKGEAEVDLHGYAEIIELLKSKDSVDRLKLREVVRRRNKDDLR